MEKGWEGVAVTVLRLAIHRCIIREHLFVTGFRTCKTNHRVALRRDEGCRFVRQTESRFLLFYNNTLWRVSLLPENRVVEGHVMISHQERYHHLVVPFIRQCHVEPMSLEIHMRRLGTRNIVVFLHHTLFAFHHTQMFGVIANTRLHAESRRLHHLHPVILDAIGRLTVLHLHRHHHFAIGRSHSFRLCRHTQSAQHH